MASRIGQLATLIQVGCLFGQGQKRSESGSARVGLACFVLALIGSTCIAAEPWRRHSIDSSLRGADGVRLNDFDGDSLPDIVTGWEESGIVRLYLNPGPDNVRSTWPAVTVGKGKSPEDAVAYDFDGDGDLDVISCHEGKRRQVLAHRYIGNAKNHESLLDPANWITSSFNQLDGQMWMFALPIAIRDGQQAIIVGAKGTDATLTLLVPPDQDRTNLKSWRVKKLRTVGWIMSLQSVDMDADGDLDLVFSDRKGNRRGAYWLEQPNAFPIENDWPEHLIGAKNVEPLFLHATPDRVLVSTRNQVWLECTRAGNKWSESRHPNPPSIPFGKAIAPLGNNNLVMTSNTAADKLKSLRPGIWLKRIDDPWEPIGSESRTKFDRMECLDLDGDGDLDVLTCEERRNLGVIWYENPGITVR